MENKRIVLLGGKGVSTNIVFNSLNSQFGIHTSIIEGKESLKVFLKRRIRRFGLTTVFGQILFQLFVVKFLNLFSKKRKNEIIKNYKLDATEIPEDKKQFVSSVNSGNTIQILKEINPDLIIVNGTRIISNQVLNSVNCKFINTHAGITPKYRGVHGTYWALVNNDVENSGVTVHFIDTGIDTGNIIYQANVTPTKKDNFVTYPLLQLAIGINILNKAIEDYFNNNILKKQGTQETSLWSHPTIWQYLYFRVMKKIK